MVKSNVASKPKSERAVVIVTDANVNPQAFRETVESIVVAVVLAFLFRTFVGEAFVIPTGSMAPTLKGNHKDVTCAKCGFEYQANASSENDETWRTPDPVLGTTCPICRYSMKLDWNKDSNHRSFTGDRILVSKFSYDLQEPRRWDVIVFKYPNNAKQNYIKRLVGLPGETLQISHGDVYLRPRGSTRFQIARKPPDKQLAMLQVVDDTHYIAEELVKAKWPSRWQPWSAEKGSGPWRDIGSDRQPIELVGKEAPQWLRYRHLVPQYEDWIDMEAGHDLQVPAPGDDTGELVTDFYAYNAIATRSRIDSRGPPTDIGPDDKSLGDHWVGDLAVEADVDIVGTSGAVLIDLVEGGVHHRCRIDVATGEATLSIDGGNYAFSDDQGEASSATPRAATAVRGGRRFSLRFSNVDDELRLWVNNTLVKFDAPTTFVSPEEQPPVWTEKDAGDLAPVGIGAEQVTLKAHRLRVLRDVYYIATDGSLYGNYGSDNEYPRNFQEHDIRAVLRSPRLWATHPLFARRRTVEFQLEEDQFFPMGDNSPQSKDGRLWGQPAYVERSLLTGKAVLVYWPHSWNSPPFLPNFRQMRMIR